MLSQISLLFLFLPFLCSVASSLQAKSRLLSHLHLPNANPVNATVMEACKALSPQTKVFYPSDKKQYKIGTKRYMSSSSQEATCVFIPTLASELSDAIKLIGQRRVEFAVSSGGHASNAGFSSTTGIMISLKGFQHVDLGCDKSYVDIGAGNIWDNVYQALEGTGVNVVGGRVTGVGVGGFITGGGGYSWKTNQYGLTVDTLIQADIVLPNGTIVTASQSSYPDLFFAMKGGGNKFGIVYNFRLATHPQSESVWGGSRTYFLGDIPAVAKAVSHFSANNKDPKAQIIPTFNHLLDVGGVALLSFYDGPDPGTAFSTFDGIFSLTNDWGVKTFTDLVRSSPANTTAGLRGAFNTVSLQSYSEPLMQQIVNQSHYYGHKFLKSGIFISYDVEPFLNSYGNFADKLGESAWPHKSSPLPLNLYFAWESESDDDFFRQAIVDSARVISDQAKAEGQDLSRYNLYPNYAISGTSAVDLYGEKNAHILIIEFGKPKSIRSPRKQTTKGEE